MTYETTLSAKLVQTTDAISGGLQSCPVGLDSRLANAVGLISSLIRQGRADAVGVNGPQHVKPIVELLPTPPFGHQVLGWKPFLLPLLVTPSGIGGANSTILQTFINFATVFNKLIRVIVQIGAINAHILQFIPPIASFPLPLIHFTLLIKAAISVANFTTQKC
nr:hypothetical protein Iba_chr06aCG9160 [Ipomoea batatas]